ncbi:MAG: ATP-binding protein, partial [Acidobacteria bacterium]|nr:ATP-binding protein [Acidobacteriota bacterium]
AQAVDAGGRVTVALEMEGTRARVTIADDGPGIPPEVRDRIFQPFFSTKSDGTGLGLAIARRIAEAHGGKLEIADADGTGTCAVVTLPSAV